MGQQQFNFGWKETQLKNIFTFQKKTGIKAGEGLGKGKYPFFTSSVNQTKFLNSFSFDGEYLIFLTGGQAGLHYCKGKFAVSNDCFIVAVSEEISTEYVYYYFLSNLNLLKKGFRGAGLKHLSKSYLENVKIPIPFKNGKSDLEKQRLISSTLNLIEGLRGRRERGLRLLDEYLRSVFWEMFLGKGFEEVGLIDVCKELFAGGDAPKEYSKARSRKFNVPIYSNGFGDKSLYGFTKEARVFEPSITISARGTIGYSEIRSEPFFPIVRLIVAIPNEENVILNYLKYVLDMMDFDNTGTSIPQLTIPMIRNKKIILPPMKLQKEFASIVERVEVLREKYKRSLAGIDELFKSSLRDSFGSGI